MSKRQLAHFVSRCFICDGREMHHTFRHNPQMQWYCDSLVELVCSHQKVSHNSKQYVSGDHSRVQYIDHKATMIML